MVADQRPTGAAPWPSQAGERPARPRRRFSLRAHLLALLLMALLPALTIGAAAAWHAAIAYRGALDARLVDTSRALALALDSELEILGAAAIALAASPTLREAPDEALPELHGWATAIGEALGAVRVVVADAGPGHPQLLNTLLPPGAPLPQSAQPGEGAWELIEQVARTGAPATSDLFRARADRSWAVAVGAPVFRGGTPRRVVIVSFDPRRLSELLRHQGLSGDAFAAVADAGGRVVARTRGHEALIGTMAPTRTGPASDTRPGLFRGPTTEGSEAIFARQHLRRASGWTVVVAEPLASYTRGWRGPLVGLAAGSAALLALSLALVWQVSRQLVRPAAALAHRAEAIAAGSPGTLPAVEPSAVTEFEALRRAGARAEAALREGEARLRVGMEAARMAIWDYDARTGLATRSGQIVGDRPDLPREQFSLAAWLGQVHPKDRPALERAMADTVAGRLERFAVEYRLRRADGPGGWVWIATHGAVAERDPATGAALRLAGVGLDVTERKEAEERQRLLMREVDHRAKNALAVVQAAVRLTGAPDLASYRRAIEGRVQALARAQTLLAEDSWSGADLRTLLEGELKAFVGDGQRALLGGPPVALPVRAAQPLAMAVHELATNAVKYGALSTAAGRVAVAWEVAGEEEPVLRLRWSESGGPPVVAPPVRRGFGSRVLEGTVQRQLGGQVRLDWAATGLVCAMEVPLAGPRG
ncbi:PAS domain-containing protein [Belnapia sp. T6]|uniref:histidine kinase n=1 Tax=Belnapia mucosa TaxID=2804532 RepID=A0ABS1V1L7_9PROT|nr:HWE histidine kinase domain-containing protein [Belnapia mucosa]MBL6455589.1 PAS domain-containing protein [Belnapia mucosa]